MDLPLYEPGGTRRTSSIRELSRYFTDPHCWYLPETAGLTYFYRSSNMTRIIPTIGRSLHFFANTESDLKLFGSVGPFACILCGVINDTTINVGVFTNEGTVVGRTGVPLLQGDDVIGEGSGSYCGWMPFQQGQAARTDSAEKVLFEQLASALERIAKLETLVANPVVTIHPQRGDINQLRSGSTQRWEEAFEHKEVGYGELSREMATADSRFQSELPREVPGSFSAFDPASQLQATEAARGLMDNAAGCEPATDTSSADSAAACASAGE